MSEYAAHLQNQLANAIAEIERLTAERETLCARIMVAATERDDARREMGHQQGRSARNAREHAAQQRRAENAEAVLEQALAVVDAARDFMSSGVGKDGEGVAPFCTRSHAKLAAALEMLAKS